MTLPGTLDVSPNARQVLTALAHGDPGLLAAGLEVRAEWKARSGLDARSYALVKLAALIALDAPPASYLWQVGNALEAGATPEDLIGVLIAIAPQVGGPKLVAAAPELMVALGLTLPDGVLGPDAAERTQGQLECVQAVADDLGLLRAGAAGCPLGIHRGADRLQRHEHIGDPGPIGIVRGRFAQCVQRLGEIIRTPLDVGPPGARVAGGHAVWRFRDAHRVVQS
jgi:4-carboxymuconolactone decarboxylase